MVLVFGLNPSDVKIKRGNGPTLNRLETWMTDLGVRHFGFANVITESGKVDKSMANPERIISIATGHGSIIALGNTVSEVLRMNGITHFKMPHPSPLNRTLNNKAFEAEMLRKCGDYLQQNRLHLGEVVV